MSNYYKSEVYRVLRDKTLYLLVAGCAALMIAMNIVLHFAGRSLPDFHYNTVDFSLHMLTGSMNFAMIIALSFTSIVFASEYRNRTITNSHAFGLSTTKVMFGKLLATSTVAVPSMLLVEAVLTVSAYLLLENSGTEPIFDLLRADLACMPLFAAGVCIFLILLFWLKNEMSAIWIWLGTVVMGSKIVELLGLKFSFFAKLSDWMIYPLATKTPYDEELGVYYMIWDRAAGMRHVLFVGLVTTAIALAVGVMVSRKKA